MKEEEGHIVIQKGRKNIRYYVKDYEDVLFSLNENVFSSDEWYSSNSVPCAFYYKGRIGIYPYFAMGSWQRFCIIPITEETINDFEQKGVELHEIP